EDPRLRHRQAVRAGSPRQAARRGSRPHRARGGSGYGAVRLAGTGPRPAARPPLGPLLARPGAVRDAVGNPAVPRQDAGRGDDRDRPRRAGRADVSGRAHPGARRDRPALPGEGAGAAGAVGAGPHLPARRADRRVLAGRGDQSRRAAAQAAPRWVAAAVMAALVTAPVASFFFGRRASATVLQSFHKLTFRRGTVFSARFAPDGQTVIYGAGWDGEPQQLFSTRPESPASRGLGVSNAKILSISSANELAILQGIPVGTLSRVPLAGGTPRG